MLLKKIFIRLFMKSYLPIEKVALLNEVEPINILNIYYKNKSDERFKIIDNKVCVLENYRYPYADEVNELRQKALIIARSENALCKEISKMCDIKQDTLYKYFFRFTFKQIKVAKQIIVLLNEYINQNSLFPADELCYE